ncbi:1626_t:CDS:2, partial [Paraglomus brasilianum]
MAFPEESSQADDVNNASSNMLLRESTELETADKTESEEEADGSMTPPVPTEFTYDDSTDDSSDGGASSDSDDDDDRPLNGLFGKSNANNGEFSWDSTFIPNLYRLIELRSDTSTTGTVDKAIIHPIDLGNLCNALAPESYHSIADIRFEKLGKEHLDLVGCYGNRELILKLLLQSNCIDQDRYDELVKSERDSDSVRTSNSLTTGLYLLFVKPQLGF